MRPRVSLPATAALGLVVLALAIYTALVGYAVLGWYSRYTADDYCTAAAERAFGFLGAQVYWYETWSGRFTYYLVSGLIELAGPRTVQVLPAMAVAVWSATAAWVLLPIARDHRWPRPMLSSAVLSGALILVCLEGAPNLDQSLYWQTGMLTYLLPLVLMTAYAGWLVRLIRAATWPGTSRRAMVANGAFLFLAGGISETTLSVQLASLAMASVLAGGALRSKRHRHLLVLLATGLLATIVSAVLVVAAPGNYLREARLTGSVHGVSQLPAALQASVDFVGLFARTVQFRARSAVLLLVFLSASLGWCSARADDAPCARRGWYRDLAGVFGAVGGGWLLLIAATIPGYFAQEFDPPERAQFVAVWVAGVALVLAAYGLGRMLARAARRLGVLAHLRWFGPAWAVGALVLAASAVVAVRVPLALVPEYAAYASAWDTLDATLRARASTGQLVVLAHTLPAHFGFDFVGTDPGSYPNPCVAQFYGVPSIAAAD